MAAARKPSIFAFNRRRYLVARKKGWKPFSGVVFQPWEKRLWARSLKIVLANGVQPERKIANTENAISLIIPVASAELKQVARGRIPEKDHAAFCKLMDWYAKNPHDFSLGRPLPKAIAELGKQMSPDAESCINDIVEKSMMDVFDISAEDRQRQRESEHFGELLEVQVKHDIFHSLALIKMFLQKATET